VRISLLFFLFIVWIFLILAPLNAFAEDKIYTCKAVIAGVPKGEGNFYLEVDEQEPKPLLDGITVSQFLLDDEQRAFYKNNPRRGFERLIPYESLADSKEIQAMEDGLSSWDELIALKHYRTYYFQYKTDDKESLKRISINAENNRTSEITIPFDGSPSYFFLRKCEREITKEPIQIDYQDNPSKKVS